MELICNDNEIIIGNANIETLSKAFELALAYINSSDHKRYITMPDENDATKNEADLDRIIEPA